MNIESPTNKPKCHLLTEERDLDELEMHKKHERIGRKTLKSIREPMTPSAEPYLSFLTSSLSRPHATSGPPWTPRPERRPTAGVVPSSQRARGHP